MSILKRSLFIYPIQISAFLYIESTTIKTPGNLQRIKIRGPSWKSCLNFESQKKGLARFDKSKGEKKFINSAIATKANQNISV